MTSASVGSGARREGECDLQELEDAAKVSQLRV